MTELQNRVLTLLADGRARTGNDIGRELGVQRVRRLSNTWSGYMGPAQRIIPTLTSLRRRGLIDLASRPDRLSGTAYRVTEAGLEIVSYVSAQNPCK